MNISSKFKNHINIRFKDYLNEVRYINPDTMKSNDEAPLKDSETIRVYHGFNSFKDVEKVLKDGLSGKEMAKRIYSYESGNNPNGLFVTIDLDMAKKFASSGVIIEFSTKVSDLEAPVWVDGRSYFVQGEYAKSFKDLDNREKQRLINRQESGDSPYKHISKSDRPELASSIFDNFEKQALYTGDLNPNMIKYVWYNKVLHKDNLITGKWDRMKRTKFLNMLNIKSEKDGSFIKYLPADDFNLDEFVKYYFENDYTSESFKDFIEFYVDDEYQLKLLGFYPKQIKQIQKLKSDGVFDKYIS